ncbi:bactofilin family protein [Hydrogenophaga sp. NFH-34]|uniref:bactofilin family protein n=1 Tax=Hydrogenophaga sp. NFH-34 TaxID=2744446 RepID=UPI001F2EE904|nr:polymer-forming cytoskeletal protein [Hydrogenophaga sp. NFH-34]
MALHFGKRESDNTPLNSTGNNPYPSRYGAGSTSSTSSSVTSRTSDSSASAAVAAASTSASAPVAPPGENGSKLTVGPNIKLKGVEITDCDTLFVEGLVEATMDSRVIQIAEQGAFKGSAEVDIAEIHGSLEGNLTVRQKLVIHATGKVTGKIRYGKVVIEEGGQLSGDIECAAATKAGASSSAAKPAMALAA